MMWFLFSSQSVIKEFENASACLKLLISEYAFYENVETKVDYEDERDEERNSDEYT